MVLLPETGVEQGLVTAERLRGVIEQARTDTDAGEARCTISLGVAAFDRECKSLEELLERADQALYRAKGGGRNRVAI